MRGNIGALGEITQVAEKTVIDDFPVIFFVHTINFHGVRIIHQVEKCRERAAQTHTTTATMADIKNTFELGV
jgi:hypothetical protein